MKTSTKVILVFVVCQILILLGSPYGYRSGLFDLMTALGGFAIAFAHYQNWRLTQKLQNTIGREKQA